MSECTRQGRDSSSSTSAPSSPGHPIVPANQGKTGGFRRSEVADRMKSTIQDSNLKEFHDPDVKPAKTA
jgi:hypothetical protein